MPDLHFYYKILEIILQKYKIYSIICLLLLKIYKLFLPHTIVIDYLSFQIYNYENIIHTPPIVYCNKHNICITDSMQ